MKKKIIAFSLLVSFLSLNCAFCEELINQTENEITTTAKTEDVAEKDNVEIAETKEVIIPASYIEEIEYDSKELNKKEYNRTTVFKYFKPYEVMLINKTSTPILMTTETQINFVKDDDSVIESPTRRDIYMRTRKRDRGRHYALQVPGIILGTCVSFGTFLLGTPVGYGIYKAMQYPTIKAARTNVNISQDLYSHHALPLRIEPEIEYPVYFYVPKNNSVKAVIIKNVSIKDKKQDIKIPLVEEL